MVQSSAIASWLRRSRRKFATAAVALLVIWMSTHVIFGPNGMVVYRGKRSEYKQLQQEIQELQAKQEQLSRQINALRSDPRTIEKEAREQLRYARPGEVIYVFPPPTPEKPDTATAEKR